MTLLQKPVRAKALSRLVPTIIAASISTMGLLLMAQPAGALTTVSATVSPSPVAVTVARPGTVTLSPQPAGQISAAGIGTGTAQTNLRVAFALAGVTITGMSSPCTNVSGLDTSGNVIALPAQIAKCFVPSGTWTQPITISFVASSAVSPGTTNLFASIYQNDTTLATVSFPAIVAVAAAPVNATVTGSATPGTVGVAGSWPFTATNGTTCSITVGALPPGLTLDPASCAVSGTPTTAGNYSYTITDPAADGIGATGTDPVTQTINPAPVLPVDATISGGPFTGTAGLPISIPVTHANGVNCTATGLPTGLTVDPVTCAISGTTTQTGAFPIVFSYPAADGIGATGTDPTTITIAAAPLDATVTGSATPGTVGVAGSWPFTATNGTTCSITVGALPPGLTLDPASCAVSGTPTTAGNYSYTITSPAADGIGATGTDPVTQTINPAPVLPVDATISGGPFTGTAGTPISIPVTHANGVNCTATGLPTGLTVDPVTCAITGTTTQTGTFPITFSYPAADGIGKTGTDPTTITIASAVLPSPVINPIVGASTLLGLTAAALGLSYRRRRKLQ